jgi:hypothetical protein
MVADYKATSKAGEITTESLYPGYRRQMDIYQFLLAQQGLTVSDRAWFVYANGLKTEAGFNDVLRFRTTLVPYDGDRSWVLDAFRNAIGLVIGTTVPSPAIDCKWCTYVSRRSTTAN